METRLEEVLRRMSHQKPHSSHPGIKYKCLLASLCDSTEGHFIPFIMPPHEGARVPQVFGCCLGNTQSSPASLALMTGKISNFGGHTVGATGDWFLTSFGRSAISTVWVMVTVA